jgi:hypothetical protein
MSKMIKNENPVSFNEKFKEMFAVFLLKSLDTTGYNFMFVPINDEQYGSIGWIIFANKNVNKEKKNFDK